jgi:inositol-phosphate phosphatase / L-galactose 1-phosphate phosphatase / histidinol-phosphatase
MLQPPSGGAPALASGTRTTRSRRGQQKAAVAPASAARRHAPPLPRAAATTTMASSSIVSEDHVALAHDLVEAAARVTTAYFRTGILADTKSDDSPVTAADRHAEQAMRALLTERAPLHAVFGEEYGLSAPPAAAAAGASSSSSSQQQQEGKLGDIPEWLWVLDPIDGTKSFVTGKPLFGTLVALLHRGEPVLGIIDQPVTRERWVGVKGQATTLNGRPISTRACPSVKEAYLYATTPHMFGPEGGETETAWRRVRDACRIPLYGCDCYAYGLMAAGHADLVVEADLKPYDYLALVPVVEGAGGKITDWRGEALRWTAASSGGGAGGAGGGGEVLAAGDARVHAEALGLLGWK